MYCQHLDNQAEVFGARNRFINDLHGQLAYLDRFISRTEKATRFYHMTPDYISKVASKWFWDKETAVDDTVICTAICRTLTTTEPLKEPRRETTLKWQSTSKFDAQFKLS